MPDLIFENPRLVSIYDHFDGHRKDLDHYVALIEELKAMSILDIGCGTGCFARMLSARGFQVIGLEPARASLEYARNQPNADQVQWIFGDATDLPPMKVDLGVMTGNVAQVFLTDQAWEETLKEIHKVLKPEGHFVFEVRDPYRKAWLDWTREKTYERLKIPEVGFVEGWCEVTEVSNELVSFRWTFVFEADGEKIISDSTLRFREREAIEDSLERSGFSVREVREAPDRPGKEWVFITTLA